MYKTLHIDVDSPLKLGKIIAVFQPDYATVLLHAPLHRTVSEAKTPIPGLLRLTNACSDSVDIH